MTFQARIQEHVVPIAVAAVIVAVGYFTFTKMPPRGTFWDIAAWFLLLIVFCALFSFFPAIAIIYGWYTGNRIGAVLAGILVLPLFFISGFYLLSLGNMVFLPPANTIYFIAILTAVCGLAGFCAAYRTRNHLAASVLLTGVWLIGWMWGFN
jgi:hypothetical protein